MGESGFKRIKRRPDFYGRIDNETGMARFYSVYSIIAVLLLAAVTWGVLDMAGRLYRNKTPRSKGIAEKKHPATARLPVSAAGVSGEPPAATLTNPLGEKINTAIYFLKRDFRTKRDTWLHYENEKATALLLKKYARAQEKFRQFYGVYAEDATELIIKSENGFIILDPDLSVINFATQHRTPINGYLFIYPNPTRDDAARGQGFSLCAIPERYYRVGLPTLYVDATGIVRRKDTTGRSVSSPQEIDSQWQVLDIP